VLPERVGKQRGLVVGGVTGDQGACELLKGLGAAGTFGVLDHVRVVSVVEDEELGHVERHARTPFCRCRETSSRWAPARNRQSSKV
jgi:hypothetical protein